MPARPTGSGTAGSGADSGAGSPAQPRFWGNFELRQLVGRGGFGEVYRAWDPSLQREVGLKILLHRAYQADSSYDEVLREARALAAVRHPNILPVYGVDRHDGRVGFWTDFIHGKTLATLVQEQGPFGFREAALIGLDVCRALSAVHRAHLLHRDIKAENVMREEGGRILLMDFGLSVLDGNRTGFAGTPRYMAPELLRGEAATGASDIYAVGVLLFYLVTGQFPNQAPRTSSPVPPPSAGEDWNPEAATASRIVLPGPMTPGAAVSAGCSLIDLRPELPEGFVRIVETAMHSDPLRRFSSAGAMSSALAEALGTTAAESAAAPDRRQRKKRWTPWVAAFSFAAVLVAAGVLYVARGGHLARPAPEGAPASTHEEFLAAEKLLDRHDIEKNVTSAIDRLKSILARDPNYASAQAALGRAYFFDYQITRAPGLLDQAREACNRAIVLDASLVRPYATLAWIDAAAGHTDLAMQEANQALHHGPTNAEAYGAQAAVFDSEGRTADAIAAAQKAADLAPDYWGWPVLLGNYYVDQGKLREAQEAFHTADKASPRNATVDLCLGYVALQLGQLGEAQTDLEASAQIQPSFRAYDNLVEVLVLESKYQEAVNVSQKALDLNQTSYLAWANLGSAYQWIPGDQAKAVEAYKRAIQLAETARKDTPEDPFLLANLGAYYAFVGEAGRSLPLLRQAVALAPENPDILFRAGDGYEILHRRDESAAMIAKSIALGFPANELELSPELAPLRADPKFQQSVRSALAKH